MASNPSWLKGAGWLVALAIVAGGGYWGLRHYSANTKPAAQAETKAAPVPVTTASVRKGDFPVYLTGLGTVEPYDTVTVRSRVDGEVTRSASDRARWSRKATCWCRSTRDPIRRRSTRRPRRKPQDEANLKNAQLNLARYGDPRRERISPRASNSTPSRRPSSN